MPLAAWPCVPDRVLACVVCIVQCAVCIGKTRPLVAVEGEHCGNCKMQDDEKGQNVSNAKNGVGGEVQR